MKRTYEPSESVGIIDVILYTVCNLRKIQIVS
jgi:hypothetical protein